MVVLQEVPYVTTTTVVRAEPVSLPVEVLVPTDAGYTRLTGTEVSTGRASVRNVPTGVSYLVRSGNAYIYTSARTVQRGLPRAERLDVALADGGVNSALLTVSNLEPWGQSGPGGTFALTGLTTGGAADLQLDSEPAFQATAVSSASARILPSTGPTFPRLLAGTDSLVLMQFVPCDVGAQASCASVRRAATLQAPAFDGTAPLSLNATLSPAPQHSVTLDLRLSEFRQHVALVHPEATQNFAYFDVVPAAYGVGKYGWVGYSGELLRYQPNSSSSPDLAATLSYGDPFPSSWGRMGTAVSVFRSRKPLPSGALYTVYAAIEVTDALDRIAGAPIRPVVLPPTSPKVDGTDAAAPRTLASRTPVLSWEPPTQGTATAYRITVYRFTEVQAGSVTRTTAATLELPASVRTLRLPEGILEAGGYYAFLVTAAQAPGWDITRQDTLWVPPWASASTVTGLLTAP